MPNEDSSSISDLIRKSLLAHLHSHDTSITKDLYAITIRAVEYPVLEAVLQFCDYNQTKAAKILGISRTTLSKKMHLHGIIDPIMREPNLQDETYANE